MLSVLQCLDVEIQFAVRCIQVSKIDFIFIFFCQEAEKYFTYSLPKTETVLSQKIRLTKENRNSFTTVYKLTKIVLPG